MSGIRRTSITQSRALGGAYESRAGPAATVSSREESVRRRLRRYLALAAIWTAACGTGEDGTSAYRRLTPGDMAPEFGAATLTGDTVSLAGLRGDVVMLNIWATWCIPCRAEMPGLQALHERFEARGLRVVGVSIDAGSATGSVQAFLQDFGVTFTILHDPSERVTRAFRSMGVPETFLIGRDGRLVTRWIGKFDPLAEPTLEAVRQALDSPAT